MWRHYRQGWWVCSNAGQAYAVLRTALFLQVFPSTNLNSSLGAGAAQAHLRSKDTLLGLLHARILDKV